jgi:tRNA A-37 threonylcarbamoyl transferase component Bud32
LHPPIKDPLIGSTIDNKFRILAGIGQGATSSVYKAEELSTEKIVAIKILHSHLCTNESLVARFEREAQAARILVHPNIVAVNEYAVAANGTPYLVMDYVDGISLQQKLISNEWLSLSVALPIFIQVCAALNVAHQAGIVHRDLKPGNIMLTTQNDGTRLVKILDFGCAMVMPLLGDTVLKVTQTGEMLGSLLYMSPEQCLDQDVDARSDCYSLACVLYETVTGKPPLSARTAFETMNKQLSVMPDSLARVRPDIVFPRELEKVIFKAMAKSPAKRYQNIVDFMDALLNLSGENPTVLSHHQTALQAHPVNAKQFALPKKNLQKIWKIYWPYVCLAFTYLSATYNPLLLPVVAIIFGIVLVKTVVGEQKILSTGEIETYVATTAPPTEKQDKDDLTYRLAHLAPLAKLDIIVHNVRKAFTYTSGDSLISMDVSIDRSTKQEIIVRPVFQRSFFWDTICEASKIAGETFEMTAYVTKSSDQNWNVIVISSNQATIVETVQPEQSNENLA